MELNQITFILVRPKNSRNIGAVCRAMKNMGLHNLTIVGNPDFDRADAAMTAVHAVDVLEQALVCNSLPEALSDMQLIVGTSRRKGKRRKYFSLSPEELAVKLANFKTGRVAILFGNEETGLTDDELNYCHLAVNIPADPAFPSLNLSHAVQIVAYQLYRQLQVAHFPLYTPLDNQKLDDLVAAVIVSLKTIGFFKITSINNMSVFFRDILARATLSGREAKRLEDIFSKISGLFMNKTRTEVKEVDVAGSAETVEKEDIF